MYVQRQHLSVTCVAPVVGSTEATSWLHINYSSVPRPSLSVPLPYLCHLFRSLCLRYQHCRESHHHHQHQYCHEHYWQYHHNIGIVPTTPTGIKRDKTLMPYHHHHHHHMFVHHIITSLPQPRTMTSRATATSPPLPSSRHHPRRGLKHRSSRSQKSPSSEPTNYLCSSNIHHKEKMPLITQLAFRFNNLQAEIKVYRSTYI